MGNSSHVWQPMRTESCGILTAETETLATLNIPMGGVVKKRKSISYTEWSLDFKKHKELLKDGSDLAVESVLGKWRRQPSGVWRRTARSWRGKCGYRKSSNSSVDRGEQVIERLFLGARDELKPLVLRSNDGSRRYDLRSIYHNFPLASQRSGGVVCDAMGVVVFDSAIHPLMVEVKVKDASPWSALIQCLQQVRLARAGEGPISDFISAVFATRDDIDKTIKPKGSWGLVIAPPEYFSRASDEEMLAIKQLLDALKQQKTEARIAMAHTGEDNELLLNRELILVVDNWS